MRASTGQWVTSTSSADPLGLVDVSSRQYSAELLEIAGLRRDQVCDQVPTGEVIAPLTPEVADGWGLPRNTVVVAGLGDGQAAGLGAGVTQPGQVYINLGTAVVIGTESRRYVPSRAYRSLVSAVPGGTTLETFSSSGTYLPAWFRREFGRPELQGQPDPELDAAAAAVPAGSEGCSRCRTGTGRRPRTGTRRPLGPCWDGGAGTPGHTSTARSWRASPSSCDCSWTGWRRPPGWGSTSSGPWEAALEAPCGDSCWQTCWGGRSRRCATEETSALGAAAVALTSIGAYADVASAATSLVSPRLPSILGRR